MWQATVAWLNAVQYQYPGWLWAWPLSVIVVALLIRADRLRSLAQFPEFFGQPCYRHPALGLLRRLHAGSRGQNNARGKLLRWAGYGLVLLCVHVAMAHPYRLGKQLPSPPEYRDTIFVIDTSVSMMMRDYLVAGERIERMTILKSVLRHFIEQLTGNRIGLTVFSEQAYTLLPLTADYDLLKTMVSHLQPATLTGRTINLGNALLYTLQQLQQANSDTSQVKPLLVLISSVNRSAREVDPRAVAAYLRQQGYSLYTIGIGASSEQAQENTHAGLLYRPANFTLLEEIADSGGGRFYWASNVDNLQAAVKAIQSAERRQIKQAPRFVKLPLYQWPLLAAIVCLFLMFAIRFRRVPQAVVISDANGQGTNAG